jgi:hypothetical protein
MWDVTCYIYIYIDVKDPFKKNDVQQKYFLQDFNLLTVNNQVPL